MNRLQQANRAMQPILQALAQQPRAGAGSGGEHLESNTLAGKHVVPERLTNKASFKQLGRQYKLAAGENTGDCRPSRVG